MKVLVVLFAAAALSSAFTTGRYQYNGPYEGQYGGLYGGRYGLFGGLTGLGFGRTYPVDTVLPLYKNLGYYGNYDTTKQVITGLAGRTALENRDIHHDFEGVRGSEILAEVGAKHALDKIEQYGQDIDSTVAKVGAVRDAEQVLDKAYETGMIYGQGEKSHLTHVLAVAVADRVLKTRNIVGKDIGHTFAQAIAVAAAQQAFDLAEHQGHDLTYAQHFAEIAVVEAIEKAQLGQFYGLGSTFVHSVAVDASNRALDNAKHHGIDISSSFARAVAVAAAQQALDHFHLFGGDMGSDLARIFAVAAAQQALEDVYFGRIGSVHGILRGRFQGDINDDTFYGYGYDHTDSGLNKLRYLFDQYRVTGLGGQYQYPVTGLRGLTFPTTLKDLWVGNRLPLQQLE